MNILVLSTYDITPIGDGGRTRYVNLYRILSRQHRVTVLAYEIRHEADRIYLLNERFKVAALACSAADRTRYVAVVERAGRHVHDILCTREYRFSADFYRALQAEAAGADVMVASHPYLAPLAFGYCSPSTVKVYEAHNVEYDAKQSYFADNPDRLLADLLEDARQAERLACVEADYVTAVSDADAERLVELYRIPRRKIATVPNGVDSMAYPTLTPDEVTALRRRLDMAEGPVAVFIGSGHAPNIDAYLRTRALLATAGYSGHMAIIGSVDEGLPPTLPAVPFNEKFLGFTDEAIKTAILGAADFALQMIFSGAGTNLKVFEYMAAGTLIVANAFGRRGIPFDDWFWPAETAEDLRRFLAEEPWRNPDGRQLVQRARQIVEEHYDWRQIAASYSRLLARGRGEATAP